MHFHDFQHRLLIFLIAFEWTKACGNASRLEVGLARHHRRDRTGGVLADLTVVGNPLIHEHGAQVGVTQAEWAIGERVLLDPLGRITGVANDDLHTSDHRVDRLAEGLHVESSIRIQELHQVQGCQVASAIIQVHVLRAWIGGVDSRGVLGGVPTVDGGVELHARIAADVGRLGNFAEVLPGRASIHRLAARSTARLPIAIIDDRLHEVVGHAHAVVRVLVENRSIGFAVERRIVTGIDKSPRLLLFARLALNELHDVGMVDVQDDHLRGAARLPTAADDTGESVIALHERNGAASDASPGESLPRAAERGQVAAGAGTPFEEHPLRFGESQN